MDDWTEDPDEFAAITAAAGLHAQESAEMTQQLLEDMQKLGEPAGDTTIAEPKRAKVPCDGSSVKAPEDTQIAKPNKELEERLSKLGELTLDGFDKLNRRLSAVERERKPSPFSLSSLNKGCLIAVFGYLAMLFSLGALGVVFHLLGIK